MQTINLLPEKAAEIRDRVEQLWLACNTVIYRLENEYGDKQSLLIARFIVEHGDSLLELTDEFNEK